VLAARSSAILRFFSFSTLIFPWKIHSSPIDSIARTHFGDRRFARLAHDDSIALFSWVRVGVICESSIVRAYDTVRTSERGRWILIWANFTSVLKDR